MQGERRGPQPSLDPRNLKMLDAPMTNGTVNLGQTGNLYHELRDSLQGVKQFLDGNLHALRPGMQTLFAALPQSRHLLDNLIYLLNGFKLNLQQLDVGQIPSIPEISSFAIQLETFLQSAQDLLPEEPTVYRDVQRTARVLTSLDSLEEVKGELMFLVDSIVGQLYELKG